MCIQALSTTKTYIDMVNNNLYTISIVPGIAVGLKECYHYGKGHSIGILPFLGAQETTVHDMYPSIRYSIITSMDGLNPSCSRPK